MIKETIKKNKACPPSRNVGSRRGFVILFAVTLSAILLAIALGVANVALKEIKFSTSAKDTNDAFFAADTGTEQALYNDKLGNYSGTTTWSFIVSGLGGSGQSCAKVTVDKTASPIVIFISKGYNNGGVVPGACTPSSNGVERELKTTYGGLSSIAIYSTGIVSSGVLAGDGTVDGHYALVISPDLGFPGPNALTITSNVWPIPPWLTDDSNSKWIGPQASQSSGNAPGDYTYETRFDLTGFNYSTAILVGQFAADDSVAIKLNGTTVVANTPGFSLLTPFTINSGFISGMNTLDFVVTNGGASTNPTGLRVDISGTVSR